MKKAVFLDRDGVLNQTVFRMGKPRAPYTLEEFQLCEGVEEGIRLLKEHSFYLIVVTNQPDVARGWVSKDAVDLMNQQIRKLLPVDDIRACFHTEKDACECRKPQPGMLLSAAKDFRISLPDSWMIGDRYSDVEAGKRAGCRTILIGTGDTPGNYLPDYNFPSLLEAARLLVQI